MFEGKRIAVSGAAGVIGTALVRRLCLRGASVWAGDLKARPESFDSRVIYRRGDLNYLVASELREFAPEIFIHLAATFERSVETPEFWSENFDHNVRLSHHLYNVLHEMPVRRMVFASSYLTYDPRLYLYDEPQSAARSLIESDPILPRNLCGAAKFYHEQELQFLGRANPRCTHVMARIFRGYGRGSRDVISRWIRDLLADRPIDVFRTEGMFDFTYADDSAEALIRLAAVDSGDVVVNVGSGMARRIADVLAVLRRIFPSMQVREAESAIPFEASQADISLLRKLTSWGPEFALETAIPEIVAFERARISRAADESPPVAPGERGSTA